MDSSAPSSQVRIPSRKYLHPAVWKLGNVSCICQSILKRLSIGNKLEEVSLYLWLGQFFKILKGLQSLNWKWDSLFPTTYIHTYLDTNLSTYIHTYLHSDLSTLLSTYRLTKSSFKVDRTRKEVVVIEAGCWRWMMVLLVQKWGNGRCRLQLVVLLPTTFPTKHASASMHSKQRNIWDTEINKRM